MTTSISQKLSENEDARLVLVALWKYILFLAFAPSLLTLPARKFDISRSNLTGVLKQSKSSCLPTFLGTSRKRNDFKYIKSYVTLPDVTSNADFVLIDCLASAAYYHVYRLDTFAWIEETKKNSLFNRNSDCVV